MSEPNPYEPPRQPEALTTQRVIKHGIGVVAIVLITPPAVFATFFVSCCVAWSTTGPWIMVGPPADPPPSEAPFWAITVIPTVLVTVGMIAWAMRASRRDRR